MYPMHCTYVLNGFLALTVHSTAELLDLIYCFALYGGEYSHCTTWDQTSGSVRSMAPSPVGCSEGR